MKKVFAFLFALSLILLLASCQDTKTNPDDTTPSTTVTTEPPVVPTSENVSEETDAPESSPNVPDAWHVFEYDGVKYDLWEISSMINGVSEWGRIGKYVIAEGHVNPYNSIFAVINTETKTVERHFTGSVLTYHSDDVNTIVYAFWNTVQACDGTILADIELNDGEHIYCLTYSDPNTCIEVEIAGDGNSRTVTLDLAALEQSILYSYTNDLYNYMPIGASSVPAVTSLKTGKVLLTYETDAKLPLVCFGQVVDAETVRVTKTKFADPGFAYTAYEVIGYLYEGGYDVYATVRFTRVDGEQTDVRYYGYMHEDEGETSDRGYKWTVVSGEDTNALDT